MSQRKYQTSLTDFLRLSSFTKFQYIPYRLLNKLFYKQEKLFEIYIYIFEITYKPIDKTSKTATTFNY